MANGRPRQLPAGDTLLGVGVSPMELLARTDFLSLSAQQDGGFLGAAVATGTNTTVPAAGSVTANHPGVWVLRSSSTANSGYLCQTNVTRMQIGGGEVFNIIFRTPGSFTGLTARLGLHNSVNSTDAVNGVYFELTATGAIVGKTSAASVRTSSATIATLAINTWYHARITINAAGTSVLFEVFSEAGALLGNATVTTNIPTTTGQFVGAGFVATNSGIVVLELLYVDYMSIKNTKILVRGAL
jgi:hypothetical protein